MLRNTERADRVIRFVEMLPINDGPAVGQPIKLDPWEEAWIRDIYEPADADGKPIVRRAVLSIARKNRKSLLVSCLLLVHLIGPESQLNAQIYSCAIDQKQAKVIFKMVKQMLDLRPALLEYVNVYPSTSTMTVTRSDIRGCGSSYQALSATTESKHGLGADFFVYDEFGEARNDELWNVLYDSQQLRARPMAVVISTQTNDPMHPLSQMIDDGLAVDEDGEKVDQTTVCHLYAADEDCDLLDEAQWLKANPALAHWKPRDQIAIAAAEAVRMPGKEANFRQRYLNQRVNPYSTLISQSAWKSCRKDYAFTPGEPVYLALDMSARDDLTALLMISAGSDTRVKAWFWKPEDVIQEHTKRDGVRYDVFAKTDTLIAAPGRMITATSIVSKLVEVCTDYDVLGLAYDPWGARDFPKYLDEQGLVAVDSYAGPGTLRMVPWRQGYQTMSPSVTAFEEAILTGALQHDGNPILTMCVMNALVKKDEAGNRKLDKSKSRFKIDGAVALAMALGLKVSEVPIEAYVSPWEDPNYKMPTI